MCVWINKDHIRFTQHVVHENLEIQLVQTSGSDSQMVTILQKRFINVCPGKNTPETKTNKQTKTTQHGETKNTTTNKNAR